MQYEEFEVPTAVGRAAGDACQAAATVWSWLVDPQPPSTARYAHFAEPCLMGATTCTASGNGFTSKASTKYKVAGRLLKCDVLSTAL